VGMAGAAFPYEADSGDDSDEEVSNLGLGEVGDSSFISDLDLPDSPQFLRKDNLLPIEGSKHLTEEVEGDRDRAGEIV
jgi:hypothetical protein